MSYDPVSELRSGGVAVDALSDRQREVLSELSQNEVKTIISIQKRVDAAGADDVEGHASVVGVGIF
jgi:hypothetical protein